MKYATAIVMTAAIVASTVPVWGEVGEAHASTPPVPPERPAHFVLADASPSIDALIERLLDALARNDAAALHRLRVTESEYRNFLLPGGGEPGKPARAYDETSSEFAWGMLNTNSIYAAEGILREFGGHKYKVKEVKFLKGRQEYAWYTAYRTVFLDLEDVDGGGERELQLGSIADVDGQFKFVSLLGKH